MAFGFNLLNGYLQARWVSHYKDDYENEELFWWRFLGGLLIFVVGMWVNVWADKVLVGLKKQGDGGYKIPRGGLFELVSCPNYFGEIMEWFGWAVMTWSWVGFGFFLYTCANLMPRARATRLWDSWSRMAELGDGWDQIWYHENRMPWIGSPGFERIIKHVFCLGNRSADGLARLGSSMRLQPQLNTSGLRFDEHL
ncbi:hypothetical protein Goarm_002274 [Gossypium armourianum]|uniref:3-oxo-5-alpha-steroid 4-dehydrogenase C-terminal domain-containing protein n=1 Tax=Gossypium armourianum TaxID=34283 RepID=A0A7J9K7L1_9ROSI|nr:hypothetical protein [Gossypium armourianum]